MCLKMSCSQWFLIFCEFKLKQYSKNNGRIKTNQGKGSRKNHEVSELCIKY